MKDNGIKTGVIMVLIFALGIFLGYYFGSHGGATKVVNNMTGSEMAGGTNETSDANDGSVEDSVPDGGVKIDSTSMSDGQKKVLQALGVDTENIVLTPEMIACAEAKVGSARLIEIQNGDSPSMLEGASLVACYK